MKYESNILERLIKTYGVVGNPKYLSEIIKQFIIQGKECYPNLFTYQSDWLAHIDEFGLNPTYTVSYTGQSIYAPNTLEKPVKSAILKGQTLVNLAIEKGAEFTGANQWKHLRINQNLLNSSKKYLVSFDSSQDYKGYVHLRDITTNSYITNTTLTLFKQGNNKILITDFLQTELNTFADIRVTFHLNDGSVVTPTISNVILLEYVEGMENWDIPYFEGMQSVQMPVLTTSNEDGTKTNILTVNEEVELGSVGEVKDELNLLTQQLTQRTETRAYQEGDESNSEVLTDMTNTRYKLPKEVIKTVDLSIVDQDNQPINKLSTFEGGTHFTTSSQDGSLLPTLSVDVVTDLEETLMVCSLEGNTM